MNRMRIGVKALALATTLPGYGQSRADNLVETPAETTSHLLRETLDAKHGAGMMDAVLRDSSLVSSDAAGYGDRERQVPLLTKTLTAALVLRLVQTERTDAVDDIRTSVAEFPDKGAPTTSRILATYASGSWHYQFGSISEANNVQYLECLEDVLEHLSDH